MVKHKKREQPKAVVLFVVIGGDLLFHILVAVSSAIKGLTSLFGMVRGAHLLYNHQYNLSSFTSSLSCCLSPLIFSIFSTAD